MQTQRAHMGIDPGAAPGWTIPLYLVEVSSDRLAELIAALSPVRRNIIAALPPGAVRYFAVPVNDQLDVGDRVFARILFDEYADEGWCSTTNLRLRRLDKPGAPDRDDTVEVIEAAMSGGGDARWAGVIPVEVSRCEERLILMVEDEATQRRHIKSVSPARDVVTTA